MRYKIVPEVRSVAFLAAVQSAVPLVPGSVEDCCTRIRDETDLASRDAAREYLTFAEALELVEETDRGYRRRRTEADRPQLAAAFRTRVFGASEALDALADGPKDPAAVFDSIREDVPQWERNRHTDWESEWRERTERLLDWSREFGLTARTDGAYRRRPTARTDDSDFDGSDRSDASPDSDADPAE